MNKEDIFFTSDHHFGHKNIIKYSKRPFEDVDHMTEELIRMWNEKVPPKANVFHLGDLFLCDRYKAMKILNRLNGKIHHIIGNHDKWHRNAELKERCIWNKHYYELSVHDEDALRGNKQKIVLMHYAMRVWNKSHHGNWQLYGHSHGSLPDDPNAKAFDVGVDCHNYAPISYNEVKKIMSTKEFISVDHHGRD